MCSYKLFVVSDRKCKPLDRTVRQAHASLDALQANRALDEGHTPITGDMAFTGASESISSAILSSTVRLITSVQLLNCK